MDSCSSLPAPPPPSRGVCAGLGEWGGQLAMLRSYAGPSLPPHTPSATLHPSRFPSSDAQHRPCGSSYSSPGPGGWPIPALSLWPGGWWRSGHVTWVGLSSGVRMPRAAQKQTCTGDRARGGDPFGILPIPGGRSLESIPPPPFFLEMLGTVHTQHRRPWWHPPTLPVPVSQGQQAWH